jgi:hypothetical protein
VKRGRVEEFQHPDLICPRCGGRMLILNNGSSKYCPNEDAHPGGLVVFPDGRQKTGLITTPKEGSR